MLVCEKVQRKGSTTYNEVADELVAEFADPTCSSPEVRRTFALTPVCIPRVI